MTFTTVDRLLEAAIANEKALRKAMENTLILQDAKARVKVFDEVPQEPSAFGHLTEQPSTAVQRPDGKTDYVRWTEQDLDPALIDPIEPREFEWNEQRKGF